MGVVFEAPPGKVLQLDIDQLWMPPGMALHVYDGFDNLSPEVSTNTMQNRNLMDHVLSHMSGSCDRHSLGAAVPVGILLDQAKYAATRHLGLAFVHRNDLQQRSSCP